MRRIVPALFASICAAAMSAGARAEPRPIRAGASAVDASPVTFPVIVNGGFLANRASKVLDPLRARCLVLDDGATKLAIVVVDTCMMPRELIDKAKALASEKTGIPIDRMLISATHTHSAAACGPALGTPADPAYAELLPGKIVEAIVEAAAKIEPAEVGWATIDDPRHTHNRRWIRKPDKMIEDPFGVKSARANMHPGYVNPDAIAPSGPVDTGLTVLSVQSWTGRPIAVLANYSMHYYGAQPVSADYFGRFSDRLASKIAASQAGPKPVVLMSQGTSGDLMWMDYGAPKNDPGIDRYADEVTEVAFKAFKTIRYREKLPLAMAEQKLTLGRRVPDANRLAWAREMVAKMGGREPKSIPEVYAKEAIFLHDEPRRELKLQAIRIGDLGIAAIPNEVFALTGLKLKAMSPLATTMNIELANGADGYIPPPEQHALGGYTTWPARTAGLEVQAEPQIVEAVLSLLEKVAEKPRKPIPEAKTPYADAVLASKPAAFWRLDDMAGSTPVDSSGHAKKAKLEPGYALYLPGADGPGMAAKGTISRAVHLAGGRLSTSLDAGAAKSVEFWFWNGLFSNARPISGVLMMLGEGENTDVLGIGNWGTPPAAGRLCLSERTTKSVRIGQTEIPLKTWIHIAFVRDGQQLTVYLNGKPEFGVRNRVEGMEEGPIPLTVGGQADGTLSLEGKIDEVAVYDRALGADEVAAHHRAAMGPTP